MLTPAQEFEQLLDRYRFTEGLCAPDAATDESAPARGGEGSAPLSRGAPRAVQAMRGSKWRYENRAAVSEREGRCGV